MDFGSVLGVFWEGFEKPKILDFRIFFDVFSMESLECNLEGQNIEKKGPKTIWTQLLKPVRRSVRAWGQGLGWGESLPKSEISSLTLR